MCVQQQHETTGIIYGVQLYRFCIIVVITDFCFVALSMAHS